MDLCLKERFLKVGQKSPRVIWQDQGDAKEDGWVEGGVLRVTKDHLPGTVTVSFEL